MNVVYVLPSASLCGGVKVIAEHVTGLNARGHVAAVWGLGGDFRWFPRPVPHRRFGSTDELGRALRSFDGAKVATFWVTASWVAANLAPGERGYYLIQDEDELTYSGSAAGTSYRLGLVPVTEGAFVTDTIEGKYGTSCSNVGIGIDHRAFRPLPFIRERYRVLTPARTTSAGPAGLKGFDRALDALRELARIEPRASVVTFGLEAAPRIDWMPHVHVQAPSDAVLRDLYSQSGVFLSTSRHEGFGLPILEAMACGCPVVNTDSHGPREFAAHGETSLVGESPHELAAHMAGLMQEPEEASRLASEGVRAAGRYQWGKVIDKLEVVLAGHRGGI